MGNCQALQGGKGELEGTKISEISALSEAGPDEASLPESGLCDFASTSTHPQSDSSSFLSAHPQGICRTRKYPHEELGAIGYQFTSLPEAKCEAIRQDKPLLLFEIEIPGNQAAGSDIFSHPLIVEAVESLFVSVRENPLTKRNSQRNENLRKVPRTCVRVLDSSGVDVVSGICDERLSLSGMISLMVAGLNSLRKTIPTYLLLLAAEEEGRLRYTSSGSTQRVDRQAIVGMANVATGEIEFADLEGIIATRAGYVGRQRVVQATYDSTKLSYCNLVRFALQRKIADIIFYQTNDEKVGARMEISRVGGNSELVHHTGTIQPCLDPKHALRKTLLRYVPLTDLQATKANRLVARGVFNEATHILSPRQGMILMMSMQSGLRTQLNEVVDVPIVRAWKMLSEQSSDSESCKIEE